MANKMGKGVSGVAFLIGIIGAILVGLLNGFGMIPTNVLGPLVTIFAIAGIVIGLTNIGKNESVPFLVAAIALTVVSTGFTALNVIPVIGSMVVKLLASIGTMLLATIGPATAVVAVIVLYQRGQ